MSSKGVKGCLKQSRPVSAFNIWHPQILPFLEANQMKDDKTFAKPIKKKKKKQRAFKSTVKNQFNKTKKKPFSFSWQDIEK